MLHVVQLEDSDGPWYSPGSRVAWKTKADAQRSLDDFYKTKAGIDLIAREIACGDRDTNWEADAQTAAEEAARKNAEAMTPTDAEQLDAEILAAHREAAPSPPADHDESPEQRAEHAEQIRDGKEDR